MMTISLCMIVKNEEAVLGRCLDTVCDLVDEIIIVDTGSTDDTKQIAAKYTDKIYDFVWADDFSAARNFAFSKATMDYIYSADADEVLDAVNRERFRILKEHLVPEIEIVQMKYGNQLCHGTVYNFDEEYRPKLFKRLREFTWIYPVHETVRLDPVVYDSDIVITHMPFEEHGGRDLSIFRRETKDGKILPAHLHNMYAKELLMVGEKEDLLSAKEYFEMVCLAGQSTSDMYEECYAVLCTAAVYARDAALLLKYATKSVAGEGCSEVCYALGEYYETAKDLSEAVLWYYNAAFETAPILRKDTGDDKPLAALARVYEALGDTENADVYRKMLEERNQN